MSRSSVTWTEGMVSMLTSGPLPSVQVMGVARTTNQVGRRWCAAPHLAAVVPDQQVALASVAAGVGVTAATWPPLALL